MPLTGADTSSVQLNVSAPIIQFGSPRTLDTRHYALVTDDDFAAFLRRTEEATELAPADVVAVDEQNPMSDEDFDDALWLSLLSRVSDPADLDALPAGARMYFATRIVEWEAGSGGFEAALEVAGEYLPHAVEGYRLLGDDQSVAIWQRVRAAHDDQEQLEQLMDELQGSPWNGVPWSDDRRIAYVRSHRDEFGIQ